MKKIQILALLILMLNLTNGQNQRRIKKIEQYHSSVDSILTQPLEKAPNFDKIPSGTKNFNRVRKLPSSFEKNPKLHMQLVDSETIPIPVIEMPAIDPSRKQDIINKNKSGEGMVYWAPTIYHTDNIDVKSSAKIDTLDTGILYRLAIKSQGAKSMKVHFKGGFISPTASIFIYNKYDKEMIVGPYYDSDFIDRKIFRSQRIRSDEIIIELFEPYIMGGYIFPSSLQIEYIGHDFDDILLPSNFFNSSFSYANADDCQVDINCDEGNNWQDEKKGVCIIGIFESPFIDRFCTGALINNTNYDAKPYILTAKHTFNPKTEYYDIESLSHGAEYYFNVEQSECNGSEIPFETNKVGPIYGGYPLAYSSDTDFLLLELYDNVPADESVDFAPYYNGWDRNNIQGNGGASIHHPQDAQKIATYDINPLDPISTGEVTFKDNIIPPISRTNLWRIEWLQTISGYSVVEPGSSGSPLLNNNHNIIGQAVSSEGLGCNEPANEIGRFGKISSSWDAGSSSQSRLKDWLDPVNWETDRLFGSSNPLENVLQLRRVSEPYSSELYIATDKIYSESIIKPDAMVTYVASNEITLDPGFHSEANSNLDIYISPINNVPQCSIFTEEEMEQGLPATAPSLPEGEPYMFNTTFLPYSTNGYYYDVRFVEWWDESNGPPETRTLYRMDDMKMPEGDMVVLWNEMADLNPDHRIYVRLSLTNDCGWESVQQDIYNPN